MENNNNNGDYGREDQNSPKQKLSYFENHTERYPDSPKSLESSGKDNLIPNPDDFDEGDQDYGNDRTRTPDSDNPNTLDYEDTEDGHLIPDPDEFDEDLKNPDDEKEYPRTPGL
jgi:hypothetical protein